MSNDDDDWDEEEYDRGVEDGEKYAEHNTMEKIMEVIRGPSDYDEDAGEDYKEGHKKGRSGQ